MVPQVVFFSNQAPPAVGSHGVWSKDRLVEWNLDVLYPLPHPPALFPIFNHPGGAAAGGGGGDIPDIVAEEEHPEHAGAIHMAGIVIDLT